MSLGDGGRGRIERERPAADNGDDNDGDGGEVDELGDADDGRWPMVWHALAPGARWRWFDRLWSDVCSLSARYRISVRSEWWADELQVEVLAAFAAWVQRYDSGEWDDPPGKLALLFDLERVAAALRDGVDPFNAQRDRPAFERHLLLLGCRPPRNEDSDLAG
jgi:hypothetical protein